VLFLVVYFLDALAWIGVTVQTGVLRGKAELGCVW
jgi:hypothetical protein